MPLDERSRRLAHPAARRTPDDTIAKGTASVADRGDGADPRAIGDLLATWLGVNVDEVEDLVDDARQKAAAIPDQRQLWALLGETLVRLHCLELEVAALRKEVGR